MQLDSVPYTDILATCNQLLFGEDGTSRPRSLSHNMARLQCSKIYMEYGIAEFDIHSAPPFPLT
jgi:hypothetical protein